MQIAVVGPATSWHLRNLQRAAGRDHKLIPIVWSDIESRVDGGQVAIRAPGVDLADCDAVLVRSMTAGSLEQIIFRMDALTLLAAAGKTVVNPPRAVETAVDKYLTLARLQREGLPVPPTVVCQTVAAAEDAYGQLGGDVVVKPLFGSQGNGILRLSDINTARQVCAQLIAQQGVVYVQRFEQHPGYDLRVLVIGEKLLAVRRHAQGDWRTNLSQGGRAEPIEVDDQIARLATRAAQAVGASLAGVDLLPTADGRYLVLEVNAVPGWRGTAAALGIDVAQLVLDHVVQVVGAQRSS